VCFRYDKATGGLRWITHHPPTLPPEPSAARLSCATAEQRLRTALSLGPTDSATRSLQSYLAFALFDAKTAALPMYVRDFLGQNRPAYRFVETVADGWGGRVYAVYAVDTDNGDIVPLNWQSRRDLLDPPGLALRVLSDAAELVYPCRLVDGTALFPIGAMADSLFGAVTAERRDATWVLGREGSTWELQPGSRIAKRDGLPCVLSAPTVLLSGMLHVPLDLFTLITGWGAKLEARREVVLAAPSAKRPDNGGMPLPPTHPPHAPAAAAFLALPHVAPEQGVLRPGGVPPGAPAGARRPWRGSALSPRPATRRWRRCSGSASGERTCRGSTGRSTRSRRRSWLSDEPAAWDQWV
jgi:hypothetical protein